MYRPALALLCGVPLIQHPEKAKAPHRGECEAFRTASLGEGGGLAVRLMSGQRMDRRYGRPPAISSNGLQQNVSGVKRLPNIHIRRV